MKKAQFREAVLFASKAKTKNFWNFVEWSSLNGAYGLMEWWIFKNIYFGLWGNHATPYKLITSTLSYNSTNFAQHLCQRYAILLLLCNSLLYYFSIFSPLSRTERDTMMSTDSKPLTYSDLICPYPFNMIGDEIARMCGMWRNWGRMGLLSCHLY